MLENVEVAPFNLNLEKVEQMVMHINNKCASLQRHVAHSSQNQSTSFHDSHGDYSVSSEVKFQLPSGREGSPLCASDNVTLFSGQSSKSRSVTYWNERELFVAATDLCQYLNGGVDYRAICMQYQCAMEILLRLLREDLDMARSMDILPGGTIDHIFNTFSDLFREGKHLLAVNGVIKNESGTAQPRFSLPTAIPTNGSNEQHPTMTDSHFTTGSESSGKRSSKKEVRVTIDANNNDGSDKSEVEYEPLRLNTCGSAFIGEDSGFRFPVGTPKEEAIGLLQSTNTVNNTQTSTNESNGTPLVVKTQGNDSVSRYKRLEELYNTYWKSDGLNMINDMIQMVFLKEYDRSVKKNKEKDDYLRFKRDFEERVLSSLKDYDTFHSCTEDQSSLRSDYVVNCLHNHVKPNEKVLDILTNPSLCRETSSLILSNMHLGDAGVKSLAPLLPRLGQLRLLDLSSNDIHDTGVAELCTGLLKHPVLESLDLSHNPLTETSAKALVNLATENIHLKVVGYKGIPFSPNTQQALNQRLQHNKSKSTPWLPSGFVSGNAGYDRGDLWRPVLTARLAPIITPASTPASDQKKKTVNGEFSQRSTASPGAVRDSSVPQTLGVLQRVRLPYRTAQLGNLRGSRRSSQSTPR